MTRSTAAVTNKDGALPFSDASRNEQRVTAMLSAVFNTLFAGYNQKSRISAKKPVCEVFVKALVQKRGVDIALHLMNRGSVQGACTLDIKADTYVSENLSLELIGQCSGNSVRVGPDLGYVFKDMQWVAYYFIQEGDVYFLDMARVFPWVQARIAEALADVTPGTPAFPSWIAGVPNQSYQSYNLMANKEYLLAHCPGIFLLRLSDYVDMATLMAPIVTLNAERAALNQKNVHKSDYTPLKPLSVRPPPTTSAIALAAMRTPEELTLLMSEGRCYHIKDKLSPEQTERLIRWCEHHAKYSPYSRRKGQELQIGRQRLALEEDLAA
ncbi:MAG: hypothetical protein Q7S87_16095 [Agitococcus sp.]|nr:hypothetical protein [Agitococcus sp.]MDO9179074.1 hypothetical protein [Agitococcus sp.]